MEDKEVYKKAKKRVESKIGLYIHLVVYLLVNGLLYVINITTSPDYKWFLWPLAGWGVGLCFHALSVFLSSGGAEFKERMIKDEMSREMGKGKPSDTTSNQSEAK